MAVASWGSGLRKTINFKPNIFVALAAFWVNFCLLGVLRSNAVIYRALVDVYNVNREEAAWPSGVFGFFMCVTGALSGFLSHHISIRSLAMFGTILASVSVSSCSLASEMHQIVYLYGALQGIGMGLVVPLTHVILNQNFTKYRAFALGIAYSGSSLGSFIFPPISNALLITYGLDGTFLLLGSFMLNSVMGAMLFKPPKPKTDKLHQTKSAAISENPCLVEDCGRMHQNVAECEIKIKNNENVKCCVLESTSNKSHELPPPYFLEEQKVIETGNSPVLCSKAILTFKLAANILSSPHFIIVSCAYAVYFSTAAIFLMVILDFAQDRGVPLEEGVFLVSAFSIGDFAGRLSFGWIADVQCMRRNILVRLYLLSMGILTVALPACPVSILPAFSVLLGILNGSVIVNHSVLLNEYLGLEKLPMAIGFSTCFVGLTAFVRPMIIGYFRDRHESYDHLFTFVGLLQISITAIWFIGTFTSFIRRRFFCK